jgi:hypothetical protein
MDGSLDRRRVAIMATRRQVSTAKRNIRRAQAGAKRKRTISHLPKSVRTDLSRNAAAARRRGGKAGHRLEDRTRSQLYDEAKKRNIPGRSSMGKRDLIKALRG